MRTKGRGQVKGGGGGGKRIADALEEGEKEKARRSSGKRR